MLVSFSILDKEREVILAKSSQTLVSSRGILQYDQNKKDAT